MYKLALSHSLKINRSFIKSIEILKPDYMSVSSFSDIVDVMDNIFNFNDIQF